MRVAFLTHEPFYPPSGGGSAEAVYLVEEMVHRKWEVHVFCPEIPNANEVERQFGITLHPFTAWQMGRYTKLRNFKYLLYPFFLQRLVEKEWRKTPFDLVFSQHAIASVTAGRLKKSRGVPVIMNFLDYLTAFMETWPVWLAPPPLLSILKNFELRMPLRYHVDGVLTVSDTLADLVASRGFPKEKILPIYYGFDAELFPYREPCVWDQSHPPIIVMHGSLDHHHLREIGLSAMQHVTAKIPSTVWRFVGHPTDALKAFLRQQKERIPKAKVECTGFVPYREVSKHLQSADLGMVPYEESTGTHCAFVAKIVEYLATGLPVVSTSIKSASTYFANEPTVKFAGFDGIRFGEAILESLFQPIPKLADASRAASERVRSELDWRAISKRAVNFAELRAGKTRHDR